MACWAYLHGRGVELDKTKARYYYELAAMGGDSTRHNLGIREEIAGNMDRALKHLAMRWTCSKSKICTQMGMQQKKNTPKHCNYTKHTWVRLRVAEEMKLPLHERIVVTTDIMISSRVQYISNTSTLHLYHYPTALYCVHHLITSPCIVFFIFIL